MTRIGRLVIEQDNFLDTATRTTSNLCRRRQVFQQSALCQQHSRLRVLKHVRDTVRRILRIHRYIRRTCLQYPQQPHHHLQTALHTDRHQRIRTNDRGSRFVPHLSEPVCQLIGLRIQLRICQTLTLVLHRHRIRRPLHLLLEQLMDQRLFWILGLRGVELKNNLLTLRLR